MQLIAGKQAPTDMGLGFPCAGAIFERVRFSYSVDSTGQLAKPPLADRDGFNGDAIFNGISLNQMSHNVLAFGLHVKTVTPLPQCACSDDPCKANACHPEDCGGGEKCGQRQCGVGASCCAPTRGLCCDNATESCGSAGPDKPVVCLPNPPPPPACKSPKILCGGRCVDPRTDVEHCGTCAPCRDREQCVNGECKPPPPPACTSPKILCGATCIDPRSAVEHCGACDRTCRDGEQCVNSQCQTDSGCHGSTPVACECSPTGCAASAARCNAICSHH